MNEQNNTPEQAVSAPFVVSRTLGVPTERHRLLARLMVRDGKPFKTAAVEAGFSQNTADAGPAEMCRTTPAFKLALDEESRRLPKSEEVQLLAVRALVHDLQNGRSRGLERTIETLGKMRIYDWFVRNSETQIGIFMGISEPQPVPDDVIDVYQE